MISSYSRFEFEAEKQNDLPIWEVEVHTRLWAGVLPDKYYKDVEFGAHRRQVCHQPPQNTN